MKLKLCVTDGWDYKLDKGWQKELVLNKWGWSSTSQWLKGFSHNVVLRTNEEVAGLEKFSELMSKYLRKRLLLGLKLCLL